ncbi:MAG: ATP-binding protein [Hyphomicrobium sp.]|jgi:two-component system sensor histidine kinase HupT/HoxJ
MRKADERPQSKEAEMLGATRGVGETSRHLIRDAGVAHTLDLTPVNEEAWIEVIQKMDAFYAELVHHQVELERKNAELEEAQQFIDGVLSAMTDVLIVCDREGTIERANNALERATGRPIRDLIGTSLATLFGGRADPLPEFASALARATQIADRELALFDASGRSAPISVNCSERHDHRGVLAGYVLIGRPIGELRRTYEGLNKAHRELRDAQQQLVVSEKMAALGRLVAGVAHELNNPISFVFGNMHALKRYGERLTEYLQAIDKGYSPEDLQKLRKRLKIDRVLSDITPLVEGTLEGAERVSDIVQDLRRFSSMQSEPSEAIDLTRVVRTAVSWVTKAARLKPVVEFDMPEVLEVVGRKGPVHQIIVNLVQNAVDVMSGDPDPKIDISAVVRDRTVAISVRDHGPGIAPDVMARIFDPFYTTKKIGEGTGLGLYVSYGLAEELGGKLEASNHAHGGAVFTLSLPLKDPASLRDLTDGR